MLLLVMVLLMSTSTIGHNCILDSPVAMCNNEGWTKIPNGYQERVKILSLSENNIKEINEGDLDHFEMLSNLNIDNCKLESVGRTAFMRLLELSYIDLSHNRLTYISNDIFQYNTKLTEVVLSFNQLQPRKVSPVLISTSIQILKMKACGIEEIWSQMFSMLEKLKQLDLSKNKILTFSDGAFDLKSHFKDVLVDPNVFNAPAIRTFSSNAVTVNFSTYDEPMPEVKKETLTVLSTSVTVSHSPYPSSAIQPTTGENSKTSANSVTTDGANVISSENDRNITVKEKNLFGASIGNVEMYTIMAVSMLVGAGLCYALIQICQKRRTNVSNRDSAPPPVFVGRGPDSTSLMHPVVYKIVPQYELDYPNDMYEIPLADTHTRHSFVPSVPLSMPSCNPPLPPLPPRPPRRSVPSYHEYEYIQSSSGDVPTSS